MRRGKIKEQVIAFFMACVMYWTMVFFATGCGQGMGPADLSGMTTDQTVTDSTPTQTSTGENVLISNPIKTSSINIEMQSKVDPDTREISGTFFTTKDRASTDIENLKTYLLGLDLSGVLDINCDLYFNDSVTVKDINASNASFASFKFQATENSWILLNDKITGRKVMIFGKIVNISPKNSPGNPVTKIYLGAYYQGDAKKCSIFTESSNGSFTEYSIDNALSRSTSKTTRLTFDDICNATIGAGGVGFLAGSFGYMRPNSNPINVNYNPNISNSGSLYLALASILLEVIAWNVCTPFFTMAYSPDVGGNCEFESYCEQQGIDSNIVRRSPIENPTYIPPGNTITYPPRLEPGVEDILRKTNCQWEFTEWKGNLIASYRNYDGSICLLKRSDDGKWYSWMTLPDCWTSTTPSITTWLNHLIVSFTGGDGKVWVGILWNGEDFSGWKYTGKNSRFAPVVRSDGKNVSMVLVEKGKTRVIWSTDGPWFQDNSKWIDTYRDTLKRPDAAMENGNCYIIHHGIDNSFGYFKNVTLDNSPYNWIVVPGRGSNDSFGIFVHDGKVVAIHRGPDSRIYVAIYDSGYWPGYKEYTVYAPHVNMFKGRLGCAFTNRGYMRFQWIDNIFSKPALESGVTELVRSSKVSWAFTDYSDEMVAVHTGKTDGKIYVMRQTEGTWWVWKILPDAYTEDAAAIATYQNHLVFAFRGYDGKIWVGMLEDGYKWTGWHFTGRTSTHAPTLASNGEIMYFLHKGQGNDTIYISAKAPYFDDGYFECFRSTKNRPAACVDEQGNLWIAHLGGTNTTIYYKNWTKDPSPYNWKELERNSYTDPSILVVNGKIFFGHQGAGDNRNYIGTPGGSWLTLKEKTMTAPFIGLFDGKIGYAYNNGYELRIQLVEKF